MRERVQDFAGELEISSSDQGTKVKAAIPFAQASGSVGIRDEANTPGSIPVEKTSGGDLMPKRVATGRRKLILGSSRPLTAYQESTSTAYEFSRVKRTRAHLGGI